MRQTLRPMTQPVVSSGPGASAPGLARPALTEPGQDTKTMLPSEALVQGRFPTPLKASDLVVLALIIVLFVSNASVITLAGAAGLSYWLLGFLTFLIPSAIITGKLIRMFPEQGAFYVWAFKALGPFWSSLLGFFILWWPPLLSLIGVGTFAVAFLGTVGASMGQTWLVDPWQQGLVVLAVLLAAWFIARLPLNISMRLIRGTLYAYFVVIVLMGLSIVIWLMSGHQAQTDFSSSQFALHPETFTFYGLVILGGLGIQLPLNMAREVSAQEQNALARFLPRTVIVVMVSYIVVWFALTVILPQDPTGQNPLAAVSVGNIGQVFAVAFGGTFGHLVTIVASLCLAAFCIASSSAYSMVQSRVLVMVAMDRRLPIGLAKLDEDGVPRRANTFQMLILAAITVVIFFLAPVFGAQGQQFINIVYNLFPASAAVLWALSALGLFIIGGVLVVRFPRRAQEVGGGPASLILLCAVVGVLATVAACYLIFTNPWSPFIAPGDWAFWIALVVLGSLAIGAVHAFLAAEPEDVWMMLLASQKKQGRP
ncbi:MAG TPA: APC family permease [Ktedonobacterales bacterium]|nr:APC family permease [Ktedonobacterales bacterium]